MLLPWNVGHLCHPWPTGLPLPSSARPEAAGEEALFLLGEFLDTLAYHQIACSLSLIRSSSPPPCPVCALNQR